MRLMPIGLRLAVHQLCAGLRWHPGTRARWTARPALLRRPRRHGRRCRGCRRHDRRGAVRTPRRTALHLLRPEREQARRMGAQPRQHADQERSGRMRIRRPAVGPLKGARMPTSMGAACGSARMGRAAVARGTTARIRTALDLASSTGHLHPSCIQSMARSRQARFSVSSVPVGIGLPSGVWGGLVVEQGTVSAAVCGCFGAIAAALHAAPAASLPA
jgi:hypothetical protein